MLCGLLFVVVAAGALVGCGDDTPQPKRFAVTLTAISGTGTNSTTLHLSLHLELRDRFGDRRVCCHAALLWESFRAYV